MWRPGRNPPVAGSGSASKCLWKSSDRLLKNAQDVLVEIPAGARSPFPAQRLSQVLSVDYPATDDELDGYLKSAYQGKYTFLILSLLYPAGTGRVRSSRRSYLSENRV